MMHPFRGKKVVEPSPRVPAQPHAWQGVMNVSAIGMAEKKFIEVWKTSDVIPETDANPVTYRSGKEGRRVKVNVSVRDDTSEYVVEFSNVQLNQLL